MTDCGLDMDLLMQDFMSPEKDRDVERPHLVVVFNGFQGNILLVL